MKALNCRPHVHKTKLANLIQAADTIRVLVATDNHVGCEERDAIRGDDSWRSFHEIMCLAKERDVDMVLLAGDLFHENKPSRKSMNHVMRSLRQNCLGEKPCELEMLSDNSEVFGGFVLPHTKQHAFQTKSHFMCQCLQLREL